MYFVHGRVVHRNSLVEDLKKEMEWGWRGGGGKDRQMNR